jgi:DNA-binding transcriptional MerR regulator
VTKTLLSIGEVAKRTGISVKTLRFYADQALVPPSGRSKSGYRLYAEADVAKLELVRTLREAGLGLAAIRAVLGRDMTLADALRLRLGAIEAHIASLRQVATALRAALRSEPTELDIRRLTA